MQLLDLRNPYRKAYRIAYWFGCLVLGSLGLALLLTNTRAQTIGAILIGIATSFMSTAVMELASLKTSVAEIERMLSESTLGALGSDPTELDIHTYPERLHHYSQTYFDGRAVWQYATIALERLPARVIGYGVWVDPRTQNPAYYSVEVGVRGQHAIFVFSAIPKQASSARITEIYPCHTGSLSFQHEFGLAMDHAWDGGSHFGRVILSASKLCGEDRQGILSESRSEALTRYWDMAFPDLCIV
jgi:hypothetical protein